MSVVPAAEKATDIPGLAKILNVSTDTVRRMAVAELIPAFKVGRVWRFFPAAVIAKLSQPRDPWAQSAQSRSRRRAS